MSKASESKDTMWRVEHEVKKVGEFGDFDWWFVSNEENTVFHCYAEKEAVWLCEKLNGIKDLRKALKGLIDVREMQRGRESGELHLTYEAFMAVWGEANDAALKVLAETGDC